MLSMLLGPAGARAAWVAALPFGWWPISESSAASMASNSLPPASSSPPASVTPNASIASSRAAASCAFFCRAFSSSSPSGTESSASFFFSAAFFAASSASRLSRASIFFSSSVLSLGLLCAAYAAAAAAAASRARGDGQRGARCGAAAGGSADGERRGAGAHPWPWPHPPLPASACRGPPRHSSLPSRRHCRRPAASGLPPPNRRRRLRGGERRSLERECREGGCILGWAALPLGCSSPQLMSVRGGLRLLPSPGARRRARARAHSALFALMQQTRLPDH